MATLRLRISAGCKKRSLGSSMYKNPTSRLIILVLKKCSTIGVKKKWKSDCHIVEHGCFWIYFVPECSSKKSENTHIYSRGIKSRSYFATTWLGLHVGGQYNRIFSWRIWAKKEFNSQRRETLLFWDQQYGWLCVLCQELLILWDPIWELLCMKTLSP